MFRKLLTPESQALVPELIQQLENSCLTASSQSHSIFQEAAEAMLSDPIEVAMQAALSDRDYYALRFAQLFLDRLSDPIPVDIESTNHSNHSLCVVRRSFEILIDLLLYKVD